MEGLVPNNKNMNQVNKVKIGLIFTSDYEIHGNGSGDFENWAYLPTSKMLDIFDTYGAKLTIMAEMGHYWAMKSHEEIFAKDINLFESQLKDAVRRGHDVQLHFHPQWIDARYEDGSWNLDFSRKTIERLCYNYDEAYLYLKKGKDDLEKLLTPVNQQYKCACFRAGYFQMQPSESVVKALEDAGFLSDSSVSKGMSANDQLRVLDYSSAVSKYRPWKISRHDVCKSDESGKMYEFPVLTERHLIFKIINKIRKLIIKSKKKNVSDVISDLMGQYSKGIHKEHLKLNSDLIKIILNKSWDYADFCRADNLNLLKYVKMVISLCEKNNEFSYVPVVFIGHSKDFFFSNQLSLFFEACKKIEGIEFHTYSEAVKIYTN
jgi:hypothetical protein